MNWRTYYVNLLVATVLQVKCYIFNSKSVIVIGGEAYKNSYFSYSLLLRRGEGVPSLIVGAPKNDSSFSSGGNIYKCDLFEHGATCLQHPIGEAIESNTAPGNFFGASLDGDDITGGALVVCAPRHLDSKKPHLRGYCAFIPNSEQSSYMVIKPFINTRDFQDVNSYRGEVYYNFAFSMLGFDVSYYSKTEILIGSPGVKKFNGATVPLSLDGLPLRINLLPNRLSPSFVDEDTYFGYAVKVAKFQPSNVWYLAGAPRANQLRGKVTLYYYDAREKENMHVVASFDGEEVGAYFGATLLVSDVDNDDLSEIIIGAPTAAGKTWDEGTAYIYKGLSQKSFMFKVKLTGSASPGSRFGSAMVTLGDLDLDGYNDIAVSAPYENDGVGAVYIYMGSRGGLLNKYSQRISPSDFEINVPTPKGFGLGLSRGNDIDGNGHNDLAIGAYKSDQVFIIKTYSVIDYSSTIFPDIPSIGSDTRGFNIQLCLVTTKRSLTKTVTQVDFNVSVELDYRSVERKIEDQLSVQIESRTCKDYQISLEKPAITNIFPFSIVLSLKVVTENVVAHGDKSLELSVPYSHECGSDNICSTDLSLQLKLSRKNFVLGAVKEVDLIVSVKNTGEPAYRCRVLLAIPPGFDLRNTKDCTQTDGNYTCLVSEILKDFSERKFILDVKNVKPTTELIKFYAEVSSLGQNNPAAKNRASIELPVVLENIPFIDGKSVPEYSELQLTQSEVEDFEVVYQFTLSKNGPSPLLVYVDIWFPIVEYKGNNLFTFTEIEAKVGNIRMGCQSSIETTGTEYKNLPNSLDVLKNRTIVLKCDQDQTCVKYTCGGEYLERSSQLAVFTVKTLINFKLLGLKYRERLSSEDLIAYVPVAYQTSPTSSIEKATLFMIFSYLEKRVPLWVYLVAGIGGVVLLILLNYGLYKCHFFDRDYKKKLEQEKQLILPYDTFDDCH